MEAKDVLREKIRNLENKVLRLERSFFEKNVEIPIFSDSFLKSIPKNPIEGLFSLENRLILLRNKEKTKRN